MSTVTAQMPDLVEWDRKTFVVAGVAGGSLFDPASHGIEPSMISTACWRGYVCTYAPRDGELRLTDLLLGPESTIEGREIAPGSVLFGQTAEWNPSMHAFALRGIDERVPFTGGLLLGEGFIRSLYVHMGFHPAWKYENVVELLFTDGHLDAATDRSAEMARVRASLDAGEIEDPDGDRASDVQAWIRRTFALDYGRSLPS